jgi:hypothetical protein
MLRIGHAKSVPDEGLQLIDRPGPLTGLRSAKPPSPTMGEGDESGLANHGAMDTGEKSTNQLFGCTKPLIFGLKARGATSCAT